ncbi:hypothetical protein CMO96_00415 [Candidatus Woesebacteria bacterium]|nr:hypothetical protein [Candidatus Woesebacteria bacterium]
MKIDNITFPKIFLKLAEELGKTRTMLSKKVYKEGSEKYRGEDEVKISRLGILGELIAWHDLTNKNILFKATPLIDEKPIAEPDIELLLDNIKIDVKGVGYFTTELMVNENAHKNIGKRPNQYWFIKIDEYRCRAESYLVDSRDVDGWELIQKKYTPAYCKDIEDISIVCELPDVLQHQDWMNK